MRKDYDELRNIYSRTLIELAEKDDRIVVVEADLSKAITTLSFQNEFPDRYVDVGVAEANMIGVAAGLATFGKIPFAHSFATFATRRCFDQVTISVAYSRLNVKIVGSDPGVSAELNGGTHMSFEDAGIMRTIPGMMIVEPVDATQLRKLLPQIAEHRGPVYIRLFRKQAVKIFDDNCDFQLGKAVKLLEGNDAAIFCTGVMVQNSLEAAELLKKEGIHARVINIHTLKPIDAKAVIEAAKETGAIVTAENHNIINGLGSAVAEILSEYVPVPLKRIGVRDHFGEVGDMTFLLEKYGMTAKDISYAVKEVIKQKQNK